MNVTQKININGVEREIVIGTYPKQCDAYHKAVLEKDWVAAHYLHIPYIPRDIEMIQSEMKIIAIHEQLKQGHWK